MNSHHYEKIIAGIAVVIIIAIGAFLLFYSSPKKNISEQGPGNQLPVACTMEAKMCPDGSYVGRSGPRCEFAACPSAPITVDTSFAFGAPVTLHVNQKISFKDGLTVEVKEIKDSRCPANVQCIWAGEISTVLVASGGKLPTSQEVDLATMTKKSVTLGDYMFSLEDATVDSVTIIVK